MTMVQFFSSRDAFDNIGFFLGRDAVCSLPLVKLSPPEMPSNIGTFFTDVDVTVTFHLGCLHYNGHPITWLVETYAQPF